MAETKALARGKNIADILDVNKNTTQDARLRAIRRTLLVKQLNTGRCTSAQELAERFDKLFEICLGEGFVPVVEMLALCSGFDRRTIHDIEVGNTHKGDGMSDVVKEAKDLIASMEAELARDGEISSNIYMFRAKNYFGMVDKQEVVVTPNTENKVPDNVDDIINAIPQLKEGSQE
jgi:hypothetical protein